MNAVNMLILLVSGENIPPAPPTGDSYWIDSTRPNPNKIITNDGNYLVFNPGT